MMIETVLQREWVKGAKAYLNIESSGPSFEHDSAAGYPRTPRRGSLHVTHSDRPIPHTNDDYRDEGEARVVAVEGIVELMNTS